MVLVTGSRRLWAVSMAVSLIIFAVLYFTVIRPDNNAANQAVRSGLQQSQQIINQAQKQLKNDAGTSNAATRKGTQALNKAAQLTSCVAAAGTDPSKVQACQAKFGG